MTPDGSPGGSPSQRANGFPREREAPSQPGLLPEVRPPRRSRKSNFPAESPVWFLSPATLHADRSREALPRRRIHFALHEPVWKRHHLEYGGHDENQHSPAEVHQLDYDLSAQESAAIATPKAAASTSNNVPNTRSKRMARKARKPL